MASAPDGARRRIVVLAAIVVAAAVVRVVFLAQLGRSELGNVLSLDSRFYHELAAALASGGALPGGAFTFNPLYPFFLAGVFRIFGVGLLAPRVVQLVLGVLTIVLVYAAGARMVVGPRRGKPSGEATASIAAVMALLYAQFVLHEGMLLGTSIEVFLLAASFLLALALDQHLRGERPLRVFGRDMPPPLAGALLGALCGAGALGRPNLFLLLVAALPLWIVARNRRKRRWLAPALGFVAGACLFLAPPIVHNARITGAFVPVSAHGGINFYIGNRPGTSGVYNPPDDMRGDMRGLLDDARAKAEAALGRRATDAEVNEYYLDRAFEAIGSDPAGWLRLLGRKFLLFWNGVEVPDVPNVFFYRESCRALAALFLPFAAIAPLAAAGLVVLWRSKRNRSAVAIFLGCAILSILLFFVNTRYRLPAVPVLIVLAAFYLAWAAREIARKRWRTLALTAALAVAVLLGVSTRTFVRVNRSAAYTFLGNYYIDRGEEAKAAEAFAAAYRLDPAHVEAMINYARVLAKRGDSRESADLYGRAYALMPRFPRLAAEYGSVLEDLGDRAGAKRLYLETYSSGGSRERILACRLLAQAAFAEGKRDEAALWVRRALEIAPGDGRLLELLEQLESAP